MNHKIETIKDFVLSQREYFADGLDISSVRRKYRREEGLSISREDTGDALTLMKKNGYIDNDWATMKMVWVDKKVSA